MTKIPSNNNDSPVYTHIFIPKDLPTTKDMNGISRTVFTHVSRLRNLLQDWVSLQKKGSKTCKSMSALKLHECADDYYPQVLRPLTDGLVEALDSLNHILEGVETIKYQVQALSKLQSPDEPIICTWSVLRISEAVCELYNSLLKEYRLKEVATENIAHCRDENLIEVYVSSWDFDPYLDLQNNSSYLFAEVGLPGVT